MSSALDRLAVSDLTVSAVESALPAPSASDHGLTLELVAAEDWDAIAVTFRDVIHEQTECFNAARWASDQLQRVVFRADGQTVGAAHLRIVRAPIIGTPLVIMRWGPMWRPFGAPDRPDMLRRIYQALIELYAREMRGFLLLMPRSDAETTETDLKLLADASFKTLAPEASPERYFVNVDTDADSVRTSMAQKWRYNLKKAEKNGLDAKVQTDAEGFAAFSDLYGQMLERKAFFDMSPVDTLESLMMAAEPDLRPEIVIIRKDGDPVAGAVIDCSGERAIYLYGASSNAALPLKAGYLMQWEVIKLLTERPKIRWYDLGGGTSPTCSLHQFKRGLVGKDGIISDMPAFRTFHETRIAGLVGNGVLQARALKDRVKRRLHRHVVGGGE